MNKPLNKRYRAFAIGCVASLLLIITGCDDSGVGPVGPPGAMRGSAGGLSTLATRSSSVGPATVAPKIGVPVVPASDASSVDKDKSPEVNEVKKEDGNPLAPAAPIEQGGNIVNLASDLISAGVNPFLNRLPKALQIETATADGSTAAQNTPPPADPLDAVKLMGIIYSAKYPIALVSVSGARSSSQLVRVGDLLTLSNGRALVARITPDSVDVQLQDRSQERRTLSIPDIIGYAANNNAGSSPNGDSTPLDSLSRDPGGMSTDYTGSAGIGGTGLNSAALGNLGQLVQQLTGGSAGQGSATNSGGNSASSNSADMSSSNAVLTKP